MRTTVQQGSGRESPDVAIPATVSSKAVVDPDGGTDGSGETSNPGSRQFISRSSTSKRLYIDPSGLAHPVAILSAAAGEAQGAVDAMSAAYFLAGSCMGDPAVQSAWSALHHAWVSELGIASEALSEMASLVPATVHVMEGTDAASGQAVTQAGNGVP